jgi:hypothetical protein
MPDLLLWHDGCYMKELDFGVLTYSRAEYRRHVS